MIQRYRRDSRDPLTPMIILGLILTLLLYLSFPNTSQSCEQRNEPGLRLQDHIQTVQDRKVEISPLKNTVDFKSYMDYRCITDQTSPQGTLQHDAYNGPDGIRYYAGCPMIAIGSGWGASVGDFVVVQFLDGDCIGCIVGDLKSDKHTNERHLIDLANGSVVEFIVDVSAIPDIVRHTGSFTTLNRFNSPVAWITKEELYEDN